MASSHVRIVFLLVADGRLWTVAGKDGGLVGKLRQDVGEAVHQVFIAATLKVGAADAHSEQRVAGEGGMLLSTVEDDAAGRMTGGLQHL